MACLAGTDRLQSADAKQPPAPILVELFTSEGCSSCPPADAWLEKLDSAQPIPGAQLIVLSEHVDYWNHDGWKDPYSSTLATDRQSGYVRGLGLSGAYTPQVIVDGDKELKLDDPQKTGQVLVGAEQASQVPVTIGPIAIEGTAPATLRAHIEADGTAEKHGSEVYAAVALDRATSQVLHGENGGRRLTHVAVLESLVKVGKLEKGKTFSQDFIAKLQPGMDPNNLRLIVFVQEPNLGNVSGAALREVSASGR
jgi:hypothetical protein